MRSTKEPEFSVFGSATTTVSTAVAQKFREKQKRHPAKNGHNNKNLHSA